MMKKIKQYVHSLMETPVMIAADPNKPVMMRWVRLLYFVIDEVTLDYQKLSCKIRTIRLKGYHSDKNCQVFRRVDGIPCSVSKCNKEGPP